MSRISKPNCAAGPFAHFCPETGIIICRRKKPLTAGGSVEESEFK
jgi:hypothetical protein